MYILSTHTFLISRLEWKWVKNILDCSLKYKKSYSNAESRVLVVSVTVCPHATHRSTEMTDWTQKYSLLKISYDKLSAKDFISVTPLF